MLFKSAAASPERVHVTMLKAGQFLFFQNQRLALNMALPKVL